jgi:hypothetical protein
MLSEDNPLLNVGWAGSEGETVQQPELLRIVLRKCPLVWRRPRHYRRRSTRRMLAGWRHRRGSCCKGLCGGKEEIVSAF